jgi:hypothetical protein
MREEYPFIGNGKDFVSSNSFQALSSKVYPFFSHFYASAGLWLN